MTARSADELARVLADEFEAAGIPYAIGGALALGVWGFPRATKDVDVDVFLEAAALAPALPVLGRAGCRVDQAAALAQAAERGDFQAWQGDVRVDVFIQSIPFYETMRQRRRSRLFLGRPAWFLSPEDLCVMKLLFFRSKDLIDVERLVAVLGAAFDREHVRASLAEIVGADDVRLKRWRQLLIDVDAAVGG